ncbi:MAG TPA: hypothetical protein VFR96_02200 [Povalibacter sp.]|jgi:hypothetical protein|nr:hypothetical protein [Povalibacter sp.]
MAAVMSAAQFARDLGRDRQEAHSGACGVDAGEFVHTILPARNLVVQRLRGMVSARELRMLALGVRNDPLFREGLHVLTDLRHATLDLTYDDAQDYACFLARFGAIGKHAVIVRGQLAFGLVRMFEQISEPVVQREQLRIFSDMTPAIGWLSLRAQLHSPPISLERGMAQT